MTAARLRIGVNLNGYGVGGGPWTVTVSRLSLNLKFLLMSESGSYDKVSTKQPAEDENVNARSRT